MSAEKVKPNHVVFNEYLRAAVQAGNFSLAIEILTSLLRVLGPTEQTFRALLEVPRTLRMSLENGGEKEVRESFINFYYEAIKVLRSRGKKIRVDLYTACLQYCINASRLDTAVELVELRQRNKLQIYQLKNHHKVVLEWEDKVDRLIGSDFRVSRDLL